MKDNLITNINNNINLIKSGFVIDNSNKKLLIYILCESITNLSKKYIIERDLFDLAKNYRQKVAHFNNSVDKFDMRIEKLYEDLLNEFEDPDFKNIEEYLLGVRENIDKDEEVEDSLLNAFIIENNLTNLILRRFKTPSNIQSKKDEKKYLLVGIEDDSEEFSELASMLFDKFGERLILKSIYDIKPIFNSFKW